MRPVAVEAREGPAIPSIDKEPVEAIQKIITTGAIDRPAVPEHLVHAKDLFHHNIERPPEDLSHGPAGLGQRRAEEHFQVLVSEPLIGRVCLKEPLRDAEHVLVLQTVQILLRVVEPIRVVNAHPVHLALAQEAQDEAVGGCEHCRFFHAERRQVIDVEKAPVVDLGRGYTPVTEPISLRLQEGVQEVKAMRVARCAVEERHRVLDALPYRGMGIGQRRQTPLDDLFFPLQLSHPGGLCLAARRQMPDGGENAVVFRQCLGVLAQEGGECVTPVFQDQGITLRRHRKTVVKVVQSKCPSGICQADLLGLQRLTVRLP